MALNCNEFWSPDTPYSGSFGTGQLGIASNIGKLYRDKLTTLADQKGRIDYRLAGTDVTDFEIVASDGTNEVSHRINDGVNQVGIVYDQTSSKMNLNLNNAWGTSAFVGFTEGVPLHVEGGYRALQGYNLSMTNGMAKIDEIMSGSTPPPPVASANVQLGADQTLTAYQGGRYKEISIGSGEYTVALTYLSDNDGLLLTDNNDVLLTEN